MSLAALVAHPSGTTPPQPRLATRASPATWSRPSSGGGTTSRVSSPRGRAKSRHMGAMESGRARESGRGRGRWRERRGREKERNGLRWISLAVGPRRSAHARSLVVTSPCRPQLRDRPRAPSCAPRSVRPPSQMLRRSLAPRLVVGPSETRRLAERSPEGPVRWARQDPQHIATAGRRRVGDDGGRAGVGWRALAGPGGFGRARLAWRACNGRDWPLRSCLRRNPKCARGRDTAVGALIQQLPRGRSSVGFPLGFTAALPRTLDPHPCACAVVCAVLDYHLPSPGAKASLAAGSSMPLPDRECVRVRRRGRGSAGASTQCWPGASDACRPRHQGRALVPLRPLLHAALVVELKSHP